MTEHSDVETVFVSECLALARTVYQSAVRINIGRVDGMWAVEVVNDVELSERKGSWPNVENQLLIERATERLEALKQLRRSLERSQLSPPGSG